MKTCYIQRIKCHTMEMREAHVVSLITGGVVSFSFKNNPDQIEITKKLEDKHGLVIDAVYCLPNIIEAKDLWFNENYRIAMSI